MAKKEVKQDKKQKQFFKDFKAELKKVIWPTPKQLLNNTTVVVVIVLVTALIVFVLDLAFNFMHESGVTKLQTVVQENFGDKSNTENTSNNESSNSNSTTEESATENNETTSNTTEETDANNETNTDNQ